jgi:hypothetical protein
MSYFFQRGTGLALFLSVGMLASYGQFTLRGRIVDTHLPVFCQRHPGPEYRFFAQYFGQSADRDFFYLSAALLDAFGDLEFCEPGQAGVMTRDGRDMPVAAGCPVAGSPDCALSWIKS